MADTIAPGALLRRRAELAGRVEHAHAALERMLADLAGLDTTIRLPGFVGAGPGRERAGPGGPASGQWRKSPGCQTEARPPGDPAAHEPNGRAPVRFPSGFLAHDFAP